MIASLMMYARPELADAHDRYWQLIRAAMSERRMESPIALSQDAEEFDVWNAPDLVLSQTCGMPFRLWLHKNVTLIGTPDYGVRDCPPGYYRSALVVRATDPRNKLAEFRNSVFAYNQTFSQSGYAAPYNHIAGKHIWFENRIQTSGHLMSAKAVATKQADIASLDAVSWRLMRKYEEFADQLRVLEWTEPTPGLPYIAAAGADRHAIFDAVSNAITRLKPADQAALGIRGLIRIPEKDYLAIPNPEGTEIRAEGL